MRYLPCALLAALAAIAATPSLSASEPVARDCGEGRRWWPPLEACVTLPVLRKQVGPDPLQAISELDYAAILYVRISAKGSVADVQVVKAPLEGEPTDAGEAALAALVEAVRRWRFSPGLGPDGKPIAMTVTLRVDLIAEE